MKTLGDLLLLLAAGALIPFPLVYHSLTDGYWRRTAMGVHLMSFMGVLAVVMVFAVTNLFAGYASTVSCTAPALNPWVRPLVWFMVAVVSWWRLVILIQVQNYDREDDEGADERMVRER